MNPNFITRILMFVCLTLCLCLPNLANALDTPAPTLTLNTGTVITLHKSAYGPSTAFQFVATGHDATSLISVSAAAGYGTGTGYFPVGTKSAGTGVSFYAAYYPIGDYTFKATATNSAGVQASRTVTVHLVD